MRLIVKQIGNGDKSKDVVIRNPSATVSNLRAAIAINFRMPPLEFRIFHASADLTNEKMLLRDTGMKDGDVVTIVTKRERGPGEGENEEVLAAIVASNSSGGSAAALEAAPTVIPTANAPQSAVTAARSEPPAPLTTERFQYSPGIVAALAAINPAGAADVEAKRQKAIEREAEQRRLREERRRQRAEAAGEAPEESRLHHSESESDEDEDDDRVLFEDDEKSEHGVEEVAEMMSLLLSVSNIAQMRDRLLSEPQVVLEEIRAADSRLFQLITTHQFEFLELVHNDDLLSDLQGVDEEYFDDEEGDEEYDEDYVDMEDFEGNEELLMQVLQAAAMSQGEEAPAHNGEPQGSSSGSGPQRFLDREPTEEENAKIEELMQLGFTRDQCKIAFYKCNRSIERAANLLFEDPPQL